MQEQLLSFPPFRLDLANEQLWSNEQLIVLRPKTFAILRYLVEHPNRLVTKDELLHAVWGETLVSEEGLRDYLREIRRALGDDAEAPCFVETVRGRGYRFLPTVTLTPSVVPNSQISMVSSDTAKNSELANDHWLLPTALPLPDKPSIIVLPFLNLSNDPGQEYFSDGITEDITNSLSRLSSLFVISRTSAFTYKGKPTKVQDISKEMGVRYVLEGSVRRSDTQVRVSAQLIDALADHHLWAEQYDRPLTDIFALQDEIVQKIATTLKLQLTLWEQGVLVRKRTDNLEAYDYYLRGFQYFFCFTKEANAQARQMYEKAVELDPQYAGAYAGAGWTYFFDWFVQWSQDSQDLARAFELALKAIALDDSLPEAHRLLGEVYLYQKQHEQALAEVERALVLSPNDAGSYVHLWEILTYVGQPEEGLKMIEKAIRLNPQVVYYLNTLGWAYYWLGRYEDAATAFKRAISRSPNILVAHVGLTATYSALGQEAEALAKGAEVLRISPGWSLEVLQRLLPFKDQTVLDRHINDLRKAGLK